MILIRFSCHSKKNPNNIDLNRRGAYLFFYEALLIYSTTLALHQNLKQEEAGERGDKWNFESSLQFSRKFSLYFVSQHLLMWPHNMTRGRLALFQAAVCSGLGNYLLL